MTRYLIALILLSAVTVAAQNTSSYDFEQSEGFAHYERLHSGDAVAEIVAPGADGKGHCLRLTSRARGRYCSLTIAQPMPVLKNLVLSFDYRAEIEEGVTANYLSILFSCDDNTQFGRFDQPSTDQWRHVEVPMATLVSPNDGVLAVGEEFVKLNLYRRAPDEGALMAVWLDNLRLEVASANTQISERLETSYANPPMFTWALAPGGGTAQSRLQYSRSPEFPEAETTNVVTDWTFHTPPAPLDLGEWFWRVYIQSD